MSDFVLICYALTLCGLMLFASHRIKMLWLHARHHRGPVAAPAWTGPRPRICVQCPLFNEPAVVADLLQTVSALRWDEGLLDIQILDDSTDETPALVAAWLAAHPGVAGRIRHVRRANRAGYKAGALAAGMELTDAEFFAIFDADFRPAPDFLETLMPHFASPDVGVVQARWEFNNRKASWLTRFQAVFLDAHFLIEQEARHAAGLFFNFNGTAGIWRRRALEDAGGWTPDTVTEDLDASYRAQLRGWRFVYRPDYGVGSELPESLAAFKSQQRRWTKGGMQVARKQLGVILRSKQRRRIKAEATWHLSVGLVHPLLVMFSLLFVPYLLLAGAQPRGVWLWFNPAMVLVTGGGTVAFYITGQFFRRREWREGLAWLVMAPLVLAFGLAMSVTCTVAAFEGLTSRGGEFVRTPKGGRMGAGGGRGLVAGLRARAGFLGVVAAELVIGAILTAGAVYFGLADRETLALVLGLKAAGFIGMAIYSMEDVRPRIQAASI